MLNNRNEILARLNEHVLDICRRYKDMVLRFQYSLDDNFAVNIRVLKICDIGFHIGKMIYTSWTYRKENINILSNDRDVGLENLKFYMKNDNENNSSFEKMKSGDAKEICSSFFCYRFIFVILRLVALDHLRDSWSDLLSSIVNMQFSIQGFSVSKPLYKEQAFDMY